MLLIKNAGNNNLIYTTACLCYNYNYSVFLKEVVSRNLVFIKGNIFQMVCIRLQAV